MARPKGSKDKQPRKPRIPHVPKDRGANVVEAPFGYSINGIPLKGPRKGPKSVDGKKKLHQVLVEKGLAKPIPEVTNDRGRPEKWIDTEQMKRLALIDCTDVEIALILGCSTDLLTAKYRSFIDEHRAHGKASLRRLQLRIAQGQEAEVSVDADGNKTVVKPFVPPNAAMAIHLGRTRLGQNAPTSETNIAVIGQGASQQGGPVPLIPNMLSPETADILAHKFQELCPDPALVSKTVILNPANEVHVA